MKIALIGATGRVGSHILREALKRGHKVTGMSRHPENLIPHENLKPYKINAEDVDALAEAIKGHDIAVVSVQYNVTDGLKIFDAIRKSGLKRVAVVGGAGSLEAEPGKIVLDTDIVPVDRQGPSRANFAIFKMLQQESELEWIYLSPSLLFFEGEARGGFRYGKDELLKDAEGKSSISMGDYAIAFLDEIENPKHLRERFTVGY